jgi:hypothetical protein
MVEVDERRVRGRKMGQGEEIPARTIADDKNKSLCT